MNWDVVERVIFMIAAILLVVFEIRLIMIDGRAAIPIFTTLALCTAALGAIDYNDDS